MNELTKERDIEKITAEIITIKQQTVQIVAQASFEIGRRLCEAKQAVPSGEWMNYLQERLDYSTTTAENLMRIYREYGDEQVDLLTGKSPAEIFSGLNQSQMVAMFGLEPAKRVELVENTPGIEEMSSRQIAELTKKVKEAEAEARSERAKRERAEEIAADVAEKSMQAEKDVERLRQERDELDAQAKSHASENRSLLKAKTDNEEHIADLEHELEQLRADLEKEKSQVRFDEVPDTSEQDARIAELEKEIEELKTKPIPIDRMNTIREQMRADFAGELEQEKQRADSAEKKADISTQRVCWIFDQVQKDIDEIRRLLTEIRDAETAKTLREAIPEALRSKADLF